jgi:general secretion pathway protein G
MQATLERLRERREQKGDEGGFTLIELLIVIVILGILAAIVVFAVQNLTGSTAKSSCSADFKTVETAAEAYKAQVGVYPGTAVPATVGTANAPATPADSVGITALLGTVTPVGGGTNLGPWLKDNPRNVGHYEIQYSVAGVEQAFNTAATPVALTSGGPPAAATGTSADCASAS